MELNINETLTVGSKTYITCLSDENTTCFHCDIKNTEACIKSTCIGVVRKDQNNVHFIEKI